MLINGALNPKVIAASRPMSSPWRGESIHPPPIHLPPWLPQRLVAVGGVMGWRVALVFGAVPSLSMMIAFG